MQDLDGISLAGLMEGASPTEDFRDRSLYFHYPHYRNTMPHAVIVKGLDKVVYLYETPVTHPGWEPIMLFDMASDAGEYENIYPQQPVRAQALYADLSNYLASVGARLPLVPNPAYRAAAYEADDGYAYRVSRGPFVGTRPAEADEWPSSFRPASGRPPEAVRRPIG